MNTAYKIFFALCLTFATLAAQGSQVQYVHRITPDPDGKSATLDRRPATGGNWQTLVSLPSRYAPGTGWGWKWIFNWAAQDPGSGAFCMGYTVNGPFGGFAAFYSEGFTGCTLDSGNTWHWLKNSDSTMPDGISKPFYGNALKIRLQQGQIIISTTGGEYIASVNAIGTTPPYTLKIQQTRDYGCGSQCTWLITGLSRVWYDPIQPGQGLTFTYLPTYWGGVSYWAYITAYDTDGSSAWWLSIPGGPQNEKKGTLSAYAGPTLQDNWNTALLGEKEVGYVNYEFIFPSQVNVTLHYGVDINGRQTGGTVWDKTLIMIPFDTPPTGITPNCANASCADIALEGRPRIWYDPAQPGQGFTMTAVNGNYWGYYTAYDSEGKTAWWLFNSPGPLGSNQFTFDLLSYSGPPLYTAWDTSKIFSHIVGNGTLVMTSANQMRLTITIGNTVRNLNLVPFDLP